MATLEKLYIPSRPLTDGPAAAISTSATVLLDPEGSDSSGFGTDTDSGLRILVVDDNQDAADSLAMLLQMDGHDSRVAHDGPQAVALVRDFAPEVAFLDIGLPGMSGHELAQQLRQRFGPLLLLVALTGWGGDEERDTALSQGFDVHLTKPADPMDIDRLLADRIRSRSSSRLRAANGFSRTPGR